MKKRIRNFVKMTVAYFILIPFLLPGQVIEGDSLALVALYDSTNGAGWTNSDGWLTDRIYQWYGLMFSGNRVTVIDLESNNLTGTLPEALSDLSALRDLKLRYNNLEGEILPWLEGLENLQQLWLSYNNYTGEIPAVLGNLSNLTEIRIRSNYLTGNIPPELGDLTNLSYLYLSSNDLEGSIPPELGNLTNLARLYLSGNQLDGEIPAELGQCTKMHEFLLEGNNLTGSIPPELGNFTSCIFFWLEGNQLSGKLPRELGNLKSASWISLHDNQLEDSILTEFGQLPDLERLHLKDNQFTHMPDFSQDTIVYSIESIWVEDNRLTFEDIEPNLGLTDFRYSPQAYVTEPLDTTVNQGDSLRLSVMVGGSANQYQWVKDNVDIAGANDSDLFFPAIDISDAGDYYCTITSTIVTDLTLYSDLLKIIVNPGTPVVENSSMPDKFFLEQNYPNPFNSETLIRFYLPQKNHVTMKLFDSSGRAVRILMNDEMESGLHSVNLNAEGLSTGYYVYQIRAGDFVQSRKAIFIK